MKDLIQGIYQVAVKVTESNIKVLFGNIIYNFVSIPHARFIDIVKYKCELIGIKVILREESYTSKCSFLDNEPIKKHEKYKGKRIKRGLFKSEKGLLIGADQNGAANILKKELPKAFIVNGIEGILVYPTKLNIKV